MKAERISQPRHTLRSLLTICCMFAGIATIAQTSTHAIPTDTVRTAELLVGKWRFVHVLGPDGQPTDHIDRSNGPNGESTRVKATGPDITIRKDGSYEKRFTPENKDTGYWNVKRGDEVTYTLVVPMDSKQGQMLGFAATMFNKTPRTDGKGNYLDSSMDRLLMLNAAEMRVTEEGYVYVYRKN